MQQLDLVERHAKKLYAYAWREAVNLVLHANSVCIKEAWTNKTVT